MPRRLLLPPTVLTDLPVSCRTNREEIFGPVVTITPFDNEEEVIGYANDTEYGLASSVWTQNLSRAHRVAEKIHTGTVWVNCWLVRDLRVPFGGMKQSGVGREGGEEAPLLHRAQERLHREITVVDLWGAISLGSGGSDRFTRLGEILGVHQLQS